MITRLHYWTKGPRLWLAEEMHIFSLNLLGTNAGLQVIHKFNPSAILQYWSSVNIKTHKGSFSPAENSSKMSSENRNIPNTNTRASQRLVQTVTKEYCVMIFPKMIRM